MSVLVKGMELPLVGARQCIISFADNRLLITDVCGKIMFEGEYVEVPTPHGRLIDADALLKIIEESGMLTTGICRAINVAPTIIEAEVNE